MKKKSVPTIAPVGSIVGSDHSGWSAEKALRVRAEIAQIAGCKADLSDLDLKPKLLKRIIQAAKNPDNYLHGEFDWDNEVAGDKWRIIQARRLIQNIRVVVLTQDGWRGTVREIVHVRVTDRDAEELHEYDGFVSRAMMKKKPGYRRQQVARAYEDLRQWCIRYADLEELTPFRTTIGRWCSKVKGEVA